jgi:hypothetical protein
MANRIVRFTQAEIVRAIKGFQDAGLAVRAIRFNADGTMEVIAKGHEDTIDEADWREGSPLYAGRDDAT